MHAMTLDPYALAGAAMQPGILRLNPDRILAVRQETIPAIRPKGRHTGIPAAQRFTKTGKCSSVAQPWSVRLDDHILHRIYARTVAPRGDVAAYYVVIGKVKHFLDVDCWQRIELLNGLGFPINAHRLDSFTKAYLAAALWSTTDESREDGGDPLDRNFGIDDFEEGALNRAVVRCAEFQKEHSELLDDAYDFPKFYSHDGEGPEALAGYCFWMNHNGHGVGFWDRDIGETGDKLSKACEAYSEINLYVATIGRTKKVCDL